MTETTARDELDAIKQRVTTAEEKRARSRKFRDPIFDAAMMLAIQASQSDVARLTAAIDAVLALHKPEKRWMPYEGAGVSYDTEQEAREAGEDVDLGAVAIEEMAQNGTPFFEVCTHCKRIEDSPCEGECTLEAGYRESVWPCPTVTAIENALTTT